jgi:predicted DNA-binding ribbon-helix-helix protein
LNSGTGFHAFKLSAGIGFQSCVMVKRTALQQEMTMQTVIVKRSIVIAGHKTSVSLEDAFWNSLKDIGRSSDQTLSEIVGDIDARRLNGNLSSAIRLFVLGHFRPDATDSSVARGSVTPRAQEGNGNTLDSAR